MRKLILIVAALCGAAAAQTQRFDSQATATTGQPGSIQLQAVLPGSTVYACTGSTAPCASPGTASLFSDIAGTVALAQPVVADASGRFGWYWGAGTYTITITPPTGSIGAVQSYVVTAGSTAAPSFSVTTATPAAPVPVTATVVGTPGSTTYYYWVVSRFTIGNSAPSAAAVVTTAAATLSQYNYDQITWPAVTGANTYDVLRTTSATAPTGACACAVATAVNALTANDQSNTLSAYTVNTYAGNTAFNITNAAVGAGESKLTFAADHGTQFSIDNITGATITSLTATHPAITPTSIEAVELADQFPGADMGAKLNAAEASCSSGGGCTIDARMLTGAQTISTPVVFTVPTVLQIGYQTITCTVLPCITFEASGSAMLGPAPTGPLTGGTYGQMITYQGDPATPSAVIVFKNQTGQIGYSRIQEVFVDVIETGTESPGSVPELDAVQIDDPVGFYIRDLFVHHDSLNYTPRTATNDSTVGLKITTTRSGEVPPPGLVKIENFWDTNDDANGPEQSAGLLTGSAGIWISHGNGDDDLTSISLAGACNIEDVAAGYRIDGATNSSVDDGCFFQTFPYSVYVDGAQNNHFALLRSNLNGVVGNSSYYVDSSSFDNVFWLPDFYGAASGQATYGTDSGVRTTWYGSTRGHVAFPYLAGPLNGATATASANVDSSAPIFSGNYWNGSANAVCSVSNQLTFASGSNPETTLSWSPAGCFAGYPEYKFIGNSLQVFSIGGTNVWEALNNGISAQTGDLRFDVDSLPAPTKYFDFTGAPSGVRTITFPDASGTVSLSIASGTAALGTSAITAGSCATVVTVVSANVAATDSIAWSPNAAPATTTNALLTVNVYPTSGNINVLVCNPTAGSITPSAETLNWRVIR